MKAPLGTLNSDDIMAEMHIANQEVKKILETTRMLLIPLKDITPSHEALLLKDSTTS